MSELWRYQNENNRREARKLARRKGYRRVGANRYGFNTIYMRERLAHMLPSVSVESILSHPHIPATESALSVLSYSSQSRIGNTSKDNPTPPGIRVTYHGGSTGLSLDRDMESGEAERVEVAVGQGLLDRRVSGHAPEPRRRTSGNRRIELGYATTAQFVA
jgi:hypothetical protein